MSTGPAPFFGILYRDWRRLRQQVGPLSPKQRKRVAHVVARGLLNEALHFEDERQFGKQIDSQQVASPLVVLGLARSGTTLLHQLLASDRRFAFAGPSEAFNPHTFLTRDGITRGWLASLLRAINLISSRLVFGKPVARVRGYDQVRITSASPQEDENAMFMMGMSPAVAVLFPNAWELFYQADDGVERIWLARWMRFLKKLSLRYDGRPLVLKSPYHMARITTIREVFPDAKFVFISRQPEAIYSSTLRLHDYNSQAWSFQEPPEAQAPKEFLLGLNRALFEEYFRQRHEIPDGHLVEVRYEDLVARPESELERVYRTLSLPSFEESRQTLRVALREREGYQVNEHAALDPELAQQIRDAWRAYYETYGYR